jgi:hypothetical protein
MLPKVLHMLDSVYSVIILVNGKGEKHAKEETFLFPAEAGNSSGA